MLPSSHHKPYQDLKKILEQLQKRATATDLEGAPLQDHFQEVQQLFRSQIASLSADELAPDYASRWQSLQTEIYKQMRLLETDLMLLLSSRSSATSRLRQAGVSDRLKTLIQYCEALLQL